MEHLSIDKKQVLRYLGYQQQNLDKRITTLIDKCVAETLYLIQPRTVYKLFDIKRDRGQLYLEQAILKLLGQDIDTHLKQAHSCVLLAITLGNAIDTKIRFYEKADMTKALILDACASAAIEQVANNLCAQVGAELKAQGKQLTTRFSPGYGDFPIENQRDFIAVLNADKAIGLTASSYSVLLPRKSITAIAGIVDKRQPEEQKGCRTCNKSSDCQFRKDHDNNGC